MEGGVKPPHSRFTQPDCLIAAGLLRFEGFRFYTPASF